MRGYLDADSTRMFMSRTDVTSRQRVTAYEASPTLLRARERRAVKTGSAKSRRRRVPAVTKVERSRASETTLSTTAAQTSGSSVLMRTPALPTVSGIAPAAYAITGRPNAIASRTGTQNPSCSLAVTNAFADRKWIARSSSETLSTSNETAFATPSRRANLRRLAT